MICCAICGNNKVVGTKFNDRPVYPSRSIFLCKNHFFQSDEELCNKIEEMHKALRKHCKKNKEGAK